MGPIAVAAVGCVPTADARPRLVARLAFAASLFAGGVAVLTAAALAERGPIWSGPIGVRGIGLALYGDRLTAILLVLVAFVGAIVIRYSMHYMDGDPHHGRFTRYLCLTLASVLLLIISGNLFQFALAWTATSLGLHRLLLFYPDRPAAILAGRKKFVLSRLGDVCLLGAMGLLYVRVGSLDYPALFTYAAAQPTGMPLAAGVDASALLLVGAALLKSAQFPVHGWLTEVMETPTPVSALLHAGIINAGGFLVLRFADLIARSTASLELLAIVGGTTALFGSVVMLTQTSVKGSLAFSTIAQMGFMMLECGLGAFAAALLHIVAHSLYKAHAFLASGSVIDLARTSSSPRAGGAPHPAPMTIAVAGVLAVALTVGARFGATVVAQPGVVALAAIVMMGLAHFVASAIDARPSAAVVGRTIALAVLVVASYFALQIGVERLLGGSLPPVEALRGPLDLAIILVVVGAFAVVTVMQSVLPRYAHDPRWQALYVHVANGFYVNAVANRHVLRYWPGPPPQSAATRRAAAVALQEEPS